MHAHGPQDNIVDNTVKIPKCVIQEFGCTDRWIGIVKYGRFALLADDHAPRAKTSAHSEAEDQPHPNLLQKVRCC